MADYINNALAADLYTDALTVGPNYSADTATITVSANPALMQFFVGREGRGHWTDDREFLAPAGQDTINSFKVGNIRGVRFRNSIPGAPAQVICTLSDSSADSEDPIFESGLLSQGTIAANGSTSAVLNVPSVTLAQGLPATPVDGQTVYLILPASYDPVGGKPVRWLCTYDAASAMWHVAGAPLYAEVQTSETTVSNVYAALATAGPSITLPRPGDYEIEVGANIGGSVAGGGGLMSYAIGGAAAADADSAAIVVSSAGASASVVRTREKTGLTAVTVTAQYRVPGGTGTFADRFLAITPVRIT